MKLLHSFSSTLSLLFFIVYGLSTKVLILSSSEQTSSLSIFTETYTQKHKNNIPNQKLYRFIGALTVYFFYLFLLLSVAQFERSFRLSVKIPFYSYSVLNYIIYDEQLLILNVRKSTCLFIFTFFSHNQPKNILNNL